MERDFAGDGRGAFKFFNWGSHGEGYGRENGRGAFSFGSGDVNKSFSVNLLI